MPVAVKFRHIFLDFDQTLFDHYRFLNWLDDQLHQNGYLKGKKGSFGASIDDFHDIISEQPFHRLYRHEDHISQTTNQTWEVASKQIKQWLKDQDKDFCYPDAHALVEWLETQPTDLKILTFGDDEYQNYKIDTCQYLLKAKMPIHVVLEDKAVFLKQQYRQDTGVLIDDKYPLGLPDNWHHFWINRDEKLKAAKRLTAREVQISSLSQVSQALSMPLN